MPGLAVSLRDERVLAPFLKARTKRRRDPEKPRNSTSSASTSAPPSAQRSPVKNHDLTDETMVSSTNGRSQSVDASTSQPQLRRESSFNSNECNLSSVSRTTSTTSAVQKSPGTKDAAPVKRKRAPSKSSTRPGPVMVGGKKRYPCGVCDMTFSTSGHAARHSRIHRGKVCIVFSCVTMLY